MKDNSDWDKNKQYPGWVAIRMWPLIRSIPTHTVCSQTKITGSGTWIERTIVWSEAATLLGGWYDQRSLRSGDSMIRGHFGLEVVWSGVTSVWGWYDQRSLQDGNGLIRSEIKLTLVWSETISNGFLYWFLVLFYQTMLALPRGNKSSILITNTSRVWCLWSEPKGSSWLNMAVHLQGKFVWL